MEQIKNALQSCLGRPVSVYEASCNPIPGGTLAMADLGEMDMLVYLGTDCPFPGVKTCDYQGLTLAIQPQTHEAAQILRRLLPFTAPRRVLSEDRSFGMGDRLGVATLGHIQSISKYDVYPVFAQQSMRELRLMGRGYDNVLDQVTFQVFQAGFRRGYGADGDHLKTAEEIHYALSEGYTMITLDCSDHINAQGAYMTRSELDEVCTLTEELEQRYLAQPIELEGLRVEFTRQALQQAVVIYGKAIDFAKTIYESCMTGGQADLEISIDETQTPTTPAQHYFVANELRLAGVPFRTLAPRFCGEFQKGVDYMGDLSRFEAEFRVHTAVARHFGYKLSVHSGSDKFAVYAAVGNHTQGKFHIKTSGTSWLESLRLVACADPALLREIYAYARTVFQEARANYHVSTELDQVPDITAMADKDLPALFEINASRQLLHITYGQVMNLKENGEPVFRTRLYQLWRKNRPQYAAILERHMDRHLSLLGYTL